MTMALMIPTLIAYLLVIKEVFSHDLPKVVSTPRRIVLPDVDSSNSEESLGSDSGHMKGRRELLAPLILSETNCPYTDGSCESAPTFLPPSGGSFNHAGAVQVMIDRAGAEVRYTLDGTEPNKHSTGVIHVNFTYSNKLHPYITLISPHMSTGWLCWRACGASHRSPLSVESV